MPRLKESSRLQRRDDIAAAAMRCFARDGFANTSMADIVREAGSSAGSVYSNFTSKSELVRYASSRALDGLITTAFAELPPKRTPSTVLWHLLRANTDRTHAQTLLQVWAESRRDPELADSAQRTTLELRSRIKALLDPWYREQNTSARAQSQPGALADAVLTALQGFIVRITIDREVDPDALADELVAMFRHP